MKWEVPGPTDHEKGHHLGRGCQRCSGGSDHECQCESATCTGPDTCECAKKGKCCKCCCTSCSGTCKEKCSCVKENEDNKGTNNRWYRIYHDSYQSAYGGIVRFKSAVTDDTNWLCRPPIWNDLSGKLRGGSTIMGLNDNKTASQRRHHCAQILLGSVCLIWSGITYMHWTGKYATDSPYWNNHILDGTGLDDGSLSQWLQALGFPREMLNSKGPKNRLDQVIWDGFMGKLFLGFTHPKDSGGQDGITAKQPYDMNYAGFVHTAHRDSFNDQARVFPNGTNGQISETDQNKIGAIFKLYILSCAYFTGLQKKTPAKADNRTPKTIREILYWLSALPYSTAYPKILKHGKHRLTEVLKKPDGSDSSTDNDQKQLKFHQTGRTAPITVHEYNLFAHFQAVTQYCPLVLIGIQGGFKGTDNTKEPAIHSLYANTECQFTYPTVSIQAYNQVVHYIRGLFYQLYFLRKQCAVKVTCGGKWRECRYGDGVVSKGVISWMCLGCDPMEHDRKWRVGKVMVGLKRVPSGENPKDFPGSLKGVIQKIGEVVVQLGNAQERLDRGNADLQRVRQALKNVFAGVNGGNGFKDVLQEVLGRLEKLVEALVKVVEKKVNGLEEEVKRLEDLMKKVNGQELVGEANTKLEKAKDALKAAKGKLGEAKKELGEAKGKFPGSSSDIDPCKNIVSASIDGLHKVLQLLKDAVKHIIEATKNDITKLQDAIIEASDTADVVGEVDKHQAKQKVTLDAYSVLLTTIDQLISICNSPKCSACGQQPQSKYCDKCHQQ